MQQTEAMEQGREGSEEKEEQLTAQQKIEVALNSLNILQCLNCMLSSKVMGM